MRKFIAVAVAVFSLAGCVVNQPTPATQVTAVVSDPVKDYMLCQSFLTEPGKEEKNIGIVYIRDYGNHFVIANREGKTVAESPILSVTKPTGTQAYSKSGLLYSKGHGRYAGFYGVFHYTNDRQTSLAFDCR